ncbi:MAG: DEAD/DEAH box helicase, partial [Pseudomonadota bacterium]
GLGPKVLRAVSEAGYASPTPIQQQAIPEALVGKDVLGIAQTGTGKTASFTLPMIDRLSKGRARARMPRSLILAPTRELAAQVAENFETYGKYHKLNMALLIGGVSFGDQDAKLTRGVDVLIATPGRLLDHFERGKLLLTGIEIMVVDEADRMLDMGFIPDIERIFKLTPFTRQTLFFSATMPPEIQRITNQFLQSPVRIEVARQSTTADTVEQLVCRIGADNFKLKREALRQLIDRAEIQNGIIFCNRKRDVDIVTKSLRKHGYDAAAIHGDLPQSYRTQTLEQFRAGELKLLVASDVAARGLDIPSVGHVFNFDVPIHAEDYVHRIGRTGRAGRSGAAFTLASPGDSKYLGAIHELIGREIASEELTDLETPIEDDRPRRGGRGRSGGRRGEREAADKAAALPTELETSQPDIAPTEEKSEEQRPGPRRRQRRGGAGEDRRSAPVIGLGDHVPAFLKRPAPKVASRRPDSEIRPSGEEDRLAS